MKEKKTARSWVRNYHAAHISKAAPTTARAKLVRPTALARQVGQRIIGGERKKKGQRGGAFDGEVVDIIIKRELPRRGSKSRQTEAYG